MSTKEKVVCSQPKVKAVVALFTDAIIHQDIKVIQSVLFENGSFEIQSLRLNTLQVDKKRFVAWIKKRLKQESELKITYDQCMHCSIGEIVLLINDGTFPRQIKDSSERSKTGLMVEVKNNLICQIKFCSLLIKTDNKFVFEIKMERIKYYTDQGFSFWAAKERVEEEMRSTSKEPK